MSTGHGHLTTEAQDAGKRSKASVNYRKATGKDRCHNCRGMLDDGRCRKVKGFVEPAYVCDLWSKR